MTLLTKPIKARIQSSITRKRMWCPAMMKTFIQTINRTKCGTKVYKQDSSSNAIFILLCCYDIHTTATEKTN